MLMLIIQLLPFIADTCVEAGFVAGNGYAYFPRKFTGVVIGFVVDADSGIAMAGIHTYAYGRLTGIQLWQIGVGRGHGQCGFRVGTTFDVLNMIVNVVQVTGNGFHLGIYTFELGDVDSIGICCIGGYTSNLTVNAFRCIFHG